MPNKAAQVGKLPSAMEVWFVAQAFRAAWFKPLMMLATIMPHKLCSDTNCLPDFGKAGSSQSGPGDQGNGGRAMGNESFICRLYVKQPRQEFKCRGCPEYSQLTPGIVTATRK